MRGESIEYYKNNEQKNEKMHKTIIPQKDHFTHNGIVSLNQQQPKYKRIRKSCEIEKRNQYETHPTSKKQFPQTKNSSVLPLAYNPQKPQAPPAAYGKTSVNIINIIVKIIEI